MNPEKKLVNAQTLLAELFPEESRPSTRWLDHQRSRRLIPFYRISRLIFFDVDEVRQSLRERLHVDSMRA
jgi:hypothetical protein